MRFRHRLLGGLYRGHGALRDRRRGEVQAQPFSWKAVRSQPAGSFSLMSCFSSWFWGDSVSPTISLDSPVSMVFHLAEGPPPTLFDLLDPPFSGFPPKVSCGYHMVVVGKHFTFLLIVV